MKTLKKILICGLSATILCSVGILGACNTTENEPSSTDNNVENIPNPNVDQNGIEYTLSDDGTFYIVSDYDKSSTSVTIPSTYNNLPVKEIGDSAFNFNSKLESITIPDSVTKIYNYAFEYCTALTSINFGNGLTAICGWVFLGCTALTSVTIPDSVTSIGGSAFYKCTSLTSIIIPNSVTYLSNTVFAYCSSLQSVSLGTGLTSLYYATFKGCTSLTNITIPSNITYLQGSSINGGVFQNCSNLTSVTFENTNGWFAVTDSGKVFTFTSDEIANTSIAAKYLRSNYDIDDWYYSAA